MYAAVQLGDVQVDKHYATANLLVNSTSTLSAPLALNQFTNMLIDTMRKGGQSKDLPSSVQVTNHPLPVTAGVRAAVGNLFALIASMLLVVVFAFIPAAQAIFVVKEREVCALRGVWDPTLTVAATDQCETPATHLGCLHSRLLAVDVCLGLVQLRDPVCLDAVAVLDLQSQAIHQERYAEHALGLICSTDPRWSGLGRYPDLDTAFLAQR